jgi:hypothetical protein
MTVIRHSEGFFDSPLARVADGVRTVLARTPPYRNTIEVEKDTFFKTNIKPSWWLLGTSMTVKLQTVSSGTKVIAEAKSQIFIFGDVFHYYNEYLRKFLEDLQSQVACVKVKEHFRQG